MNGRRVALLDLRRNKAPDRERFRLMFISCGRDKGAELPIGNRGSVNPEIVHAYTSRRRLFGIMVIRSHPEGSATNEGHVLIFDRHVIMHGLLGHPVIRSEEHTSELQSLMRISYAVFCLKKKTKNTKDK